MCENERNLEKDRKVANAVVVALVDFLRQCRVDHDTPQPHLDFICGSEAGTSATCDL